MLYVTGMNGNSGRWLFKRLEKENYKGKIRIVMRDSKESFPEKYFFFEGSRLNLEFVHGDLDNYDFLVDSLSGVDTIIHIAGIHLSSKIIDAAIVQGVKWAILVHTTGRYSNFKSASAQYIQIEDTLLNKREEIGITVVRPTMIYGSSQDKNMYKLIAYLASHKCFPLFGNGLNKMQPVHAMDLGNAYYDILLNPDKTFNKEYNLSGKEPISYLDIIKTVKNQLSSKVVIVPIPIAISVLAAKIYNLLFKKSALITVEQVLRMKEDKVFSHAEAFNDFGFNPLSFEEGIREEINEYMGKL